MKESEKTQECRKCGTYWFNGACRTGVACPRCNSTDTFFTGEFGLASDVKTFRRKIKQARREFNQISPRQSDFVILASDDWRVYDNGSWREMNCEEQIRASA